MMFTDKKCPRLAPVGPPSANLDKPMNCHGIPVNPVNITSQSHSEEGLLSVTSQNSFLMNTWKC